MITMGFLKIHPQKLRSLQITLKNVAPLHWLASFMPVITLLLGELHVHSKTQDQSQKIPGQSADMNISPSLTLFKYKWASLEHVQIINIKTVKKCKDSLRSHSDITLPHSSTQRTRKDI